MLIYLYGPDTYRLKKKLELISSEYKKKHSALTIEHFAMDEKEAGARLLDFLKNQSLFGAMRFGVIIHAEEAEGLSEILKSVKDDPDTILVVTSQKKLGTGFSFLFKKPTLTESFEMLKGAELLKEIEHEARLRTLRIDAKKAAQYAELWNGDLSMIMNELERVSLGGEEEKHGSAPEFFALVQTVKNRNSTAACLSALAYLFEQEEPAAAFNVIASLADPELKIKMADYDVVVKSGKLEYEEALLHLVL
jgi:DNA polymerase III delta subunit